MFIPYLRFMTRIALFTSADGSIYWTKRHYLRTFISVVILVITSFTSALAQSTPPANTTATAGWTPLALQPGAPAGSYPLGDFDSVNLFNGHLNFRLPLMQVGGRGRAGYTMMLPIEQNWIVQTVAVPTCNQSGCTYYESNYRYIANPVWWTGIQPGLGPGVLQGRQSGSDETTVIGCAGPFFTRTLTRLTFTAPDGTEIEFRDMASRGEPMQGSGCYGGPNRGKTFISADGSAATFISDTDIYDERQPHFPNVIYPSGYLMLRDGTRYRIDSGKTSWIRDSNGNKVTFTYSGNTLTGIDDPLNRHIGFTADGITFRGADGATRTIKIHGGSLSTVLRKHPDGSTEYTVKTFAQLFPALQNVQNGTFDPWVTTAVELPDGRQYEFRYDSYANLAQVILPTGGRIEYDWIVGTYQQGDHVFGIYKRVLERRTALDATTPTYETKTTYQVAGSEVTVDNVDPKNGNALLARTKHFFYGSWLPSLWSKGTDYPSWQEGREYKTEFFATNGTTVLKRIENTWRQKANVNWWTSSPDSAPPYDPRLVDVTTTLVDTNQVTKTTAISPIDGSVGFDDYNNRTDVWEYDYGSGVAGPLLRHTHTNFLTSGYDTVNPIWNNANHSITSHIRDLPTQVSVYDAAGTEKARTTFEYDNYVPDSSTFHAALVDRVNISGHDLSIGTSYYGRGNVTAPVSLPATCRYGDYVVQPIRHRRECHESAGSAQHCRKYRRDFH